MLGKFHLLVVDDDPDKSSMLELALAAEGYDIHTATNGREALAAIQSYPPDLVVTDVMMPEVNGYELARRMRENPSTRFIPVILQSGTQIEAKDLRIGAKAGALGFLTDPADLDLLLSRVRTLLDFKAYLDTCEEAAFTDHLTGLANRRRFERHLGREIERAVRYKHPFCLMLIDIDEFKQVNDTFGHKVGDDAIRMLAKILEEGIRGVDLAARIGGDEFALVIPETSAIAGFEVADRLRRAIKASEIPTAGSAATRITASFGIVECASGTQTVSDLLMRADAALYEAKREGRDRVIQGQQVKGNSTRAAMAS